MGVALAPGYVIMYESAAYNVPTRQQGEKSYARRYELMRHVARLYVWLVRLTGQPVCACRTVRDGMCLASIMACPSGGCSCWRHC
jgi:hypothetical protein